MRTIGVGIALLAGGSVACWVAVRSWLTNWGATSVEAERPLPGDTLIADVGTQSTMAVTVDAPPAAVWRWLVQMGVDRAGLYSNLVVENTILRLGVVNGDRIVPEWQNLKVGDHIWFTPEDYPTPRMGPVVVEIEPNRALVLCHGESDQLCPGTWQFVLEQTDEGATRLLFRERRSAEQPLSSRLPNLIMEPGYYIMDRAMLLGIKARAECYGVANDAQLSSS